MLKVYSTPTCPWCKKVKSYLTSQEIAFEEINVASDLEGRKEMVKLSGQQAVPVIQINEEIIVGFNKEAIDKAIGV